MCSTLSAQSAHRQPRLPAYLPSWVKRLRLIAMQSNDGDINADDRESSNSLPAHASFVVGHQASRRELQLLTERCTEHYVDEPSSAGNQPERLCIAIIRHAVTAFSQLSQLSFAKTICMLTAVVLSQYFHRLDGAATMLKLIMYRYWSRTLRRV